jgi:hypothetical protein
MNSYPYRILLGAGLAMLVGVVGAQTYGDQPAADKNAPQNMQAQPSSAPTPASGGDTPYSTTDKSAPKATQAQPSSASDQTRAKATKSAQHAAKPRSKPEQTAMQGEKAYREALRQCAREQDQNARDSCLDNAIQQFHRSI